jgi:hypothetical protein
MKLKDGITKAYTTHWSMINTFTVQFNFGKNVNMKNLLKTKFDDSLNLHIVSVDTPSFQNTPIETFIGNKWRVQNGRDELYKFSITFRDKDQMRIYKSFFNLYKETREQYFDNCCLSVIIYKDADHYNEGNKKFMELNGTIIESISQLQFSNDTQNQIAEFTVSFKCISPNIF